MQFQFRTFVEYLAIATYLIAAFAIVGAPVKLALRACGVSIGRVVPAPVIGSALVVLASWYWATPFGGTRPVARILLVAGIVASLALGAWMLRRRDDLRSFVHDLDVRSCLMLGVLCFAGITTAFVATDGQLFVRSHFTVLTLGNNDAASYALISQHLLDEGPEDPGNIAGYDAGARSLGFSGGACALLAAGASLTGLDVWRVMTPMMLVALVLGAYSLGLLLREILGRERTVLIGVAVVLGFSVLYSAYLVAQWYYAQFTGMALVFTIGAVLYRAMRSTARRDTLASIGMVGLILAAGLSVYPHMTIMGSIVLLPVVAVTHESFGSLVRRGVRTAVVYAAGGVLAVALAPGLLVDAVDITRELEGVEAGWSLPSIYPTEMLGFQTDVRAGQGLLTTAASVAVVAALGLCGAIAWRRKRGDAALPLLMAIVVVLATYIAVYQREGGPTYRQWKWVTFFIPLFVAAAIALPALVVSSARQFASLWNRALTAALVFYGAVVLLFATGAGFPLSPPAAAYLSVTLDEINLRYDDQLAELPSLHINTSPYWETMWLAYFLRDVPVTLGPPTYYTTAPPAGPWYLERNDQPLAPGAEATQLNATYRLVEMPG
jgi:hypothetical protein